ncbi:MAG: BACON domain-containing protein [Bryobacteraceae bacterium]
MSFFSRFLSLVAVCSAAVVSAQTVPLSFNPIAAQYSSALDRVVMISSSPNLLHIYDPATNNDVTVALGSTPILVSVSPDGLHAAVGAASGSYYVDLKAGTVVSTYPTGVGSGSGSVLLSNTGLLILEVAAADPFNTAAALYVDLGSRQSTTITSIPGLTLTGAGVDPANGQIDLTNADEFYRLAVNGSAISLTAWPYRNGPLAWGSVWFSQDGSRVYAGNGVVVNSSTNSAEDMTYVSNVQAGYVLQALADSTTRAQVAYIMQLNSEATPPTDDMHVALLNSPSLTPAGSLSLTPFTVGSTAFAAHGRFLFFRSDSSNLYVINQADPTSGLTNNYEIQTIALNEAPDCAATVDTTSVNDSGNGALYTVNVTTGTNCAFVANSDDPWITIASGPNGSGNVPLVFEVQRNSTGNGRSGSISIDGQMVTVTQGVPAGNQPLVPVSINPVASDYDKALDRFVMVSAVPNEMPIFDPVANVDQVVPLGPTPLSLAISADGLSAIVGHDGWATSIDLVHAQVLKCTRCRMWQTW